MVVCHTSLRPFSINAIPRDRLSNVTSSADQPTSYIQSGIETWGTSRRRSVNVNGDCLQGQTTHGEECNSVRIVWRRSYIFPRSGTCCSSSPRLSVRLSFPGEFPPLSAFSLHSHWFLSSLRTTHRNTDNGWQ